MDELNALSLEYQRDYGTAVRNLEITDLMDDSLVQGVVGVFGLRLPEERSDLTAREIGAVRDDLADSLLVTEDAV